MKLFILLYFIIIISTAGQEQKDRVEEKPKPVSRFTTGATMEVLETRFAKTEKNSKTNVFAEYRGDSWRVFAERRKERNLGSFEFKNNYIYFSAGHRYKAVEGFYILRDKDFYSAFQNPISGIIQQPLVQNGWLGVFPNKWSGGLFFGKDMAEKKPGIYLKTPGDILSLTYSPETKIFFHALNVRDFYFGKDRKDGELTISSQGIGNKKNFFGYFNLRYFHINRGLELEFSTYREEKGNLFATNPDNISGESRSNAYFIKLSRYHYDRLESFWNFSGNKKETIAGANMAVISGKLGAICVGGRFYKNLDETKSDKLRETSSGAGSISYEYRKKSTEFMLRGERRENGDSLAEIKYTIRPVPEWRFELSSLLQKEGNLYRSLYEQWSDGENINTILTDRTAAIKVKIIGPFLILNFSGTRRAENVGDVYFANFQFKLDF